MKIRNVLYFGKYALLWDFKILFLNAGERMQSYPALCFVELLVFLGVFNITVLPLLMTPQTVYMCPVDLIQYICFLSAIYVRLALQSRDANSI